MRPFVVLALMGLFVIAGVPALAPPVAAYCDPVLSAVLGECTNACEITAAVLGRILPGGGNCPH